MGASQFVGRVGGLAVALGIGAGVFTGAGAAWADGSAPDTRTSAADSASNSAQANSSEASPSNRGRATTAVRGAGKQVAYTYTVHSFDGVPISMNYFPATANSSLPTLGNKQATIFNNPGLAAPGETNPYGSFQAAGSTPGLGLMRGQGLPAALSSAPLGFNVITWDPRGEFASGGILQLDNPFYEGRDVSSLISWAEGQHPASLRGR